MKLSSYFVSMSDILSLAKIIQKHSDDKLKLSEAQEMAAKLAGYSSLHEARQFFTKKEEQKIQFDNTLVSIFNISPVLPKVLSQMNESLKNEGSELIYLGEAIDINWKSSRKERSICVPLAETPHIALIGQSRSGKTKSCLMLTSMLAMAYPDSQFYFMDGKSSPEYDLMAYQLSVFPVAKYASGANPLAGVETILSHIWAIYQQRTILFENARKKGKPSSTIYDYRKNTGPMEQIFCIIDELSVFIALMDFDKSFQEEGTEAYMLKRLMAEAASFGIHFILASQRYQATDIPTSVRANVCGIMFHQLQKTDAKTHGVPYATELETGEFLVTAPGIYDETNQMSHAKAKMPYIGNGEQIKNLLLTHFKDKISKDDRKEFSKDKNRRKTISFQPSWFMQKYFSENKKELIFLGETDNKDYIEKFNTPFVFSSLDENKHFLITGATGTGKSISAMTMIATQFVSSPLTQFVILDLISTGNADFNYGNEYDYLKNKQIEIIKRKNNDIEKTLENIYKNKLLLRKEHFKNMSSQNNIFTSLFGYRKNKGNISSLILVIDETSLLLDLISYNENKEKDGTSAFYLSKLITEGAEVGIHIIFINQNNTVPSEWNSYLTTSLHHNQIGYHNDKEVMEIGEFILKTNNFVNDKLLNVKASFPLIKNSDKIRNFIKENK